MDKIYVIDTNVFLDNPEAINAFDDNTVIIPEVVLEELDNFKKGKELINVNARTIARTLQRLKENAQQGENLLTGVTLKNKGKLFIKSADNTITLPIAWDVNKRDNEILRTCLTLMTEYENVILVSKDVFLRIKADVLNIKNEEYKTEQVCKIEEQYTGRMNVYLSDENFDFYVNNGYIDVKNLYQVLTSDTEYEEYYAVKDFPVYPNEFAIVKNASGNGTMLGKVDKQCQQLIKFEYAHMHPCGLTPRNFSQVCMMEALYDDSIQCVIVKGSAGSGKTLFSLAVPLEQVMENNEKYHKISLFRSSKAFEDEVGFLKGTLEEKNYPLTFGIRDAAQTLVANDDDDEKEKEDKVQELFDRRYITMESLTYVRGRNLNDSYILVEEAQNISPNSIKSLLERCTDTSRIIFTGDPQQVDSNGMYLNERNNGISFISERLKESPNVAVITCTENDVVRSEIAKDAVKYLN